MTTYAYYMADLTRSKTASHGIINYSLGLLSGLAPRLESWERLVVLGNAGMKSELEQLLPDLSRLEWFLTDEPGNSADRLLADHFHSVRWARRARADVLHFPKGFIPRLPSRNLRIVATVHDDIPIRYAAGDFGATSASGQSKYFAASIKHTVNGADAVLAVSDFTKLRLETLFPAHKAPIYVTHEGALPLVTSRGHSWPKLNRLFIFGSTHPHKQTESTIEFARRYLRATQADLELVVLGRVSQDVSAIIDGVPRARHLEGFVESDELVDLVAQSRVLIWGSAYEGFGLPPLEAALLGTAVVYRSIPAVSEVMGDTHFPFADSYDSFAVALDAALAAPEDLLVGYGRELANRFQWSDVAERTLQAYRGVL